MVSTKKSAQRSVQKSFDLTGKVAVITGGAGFLGLRHAEAILEANGTAVLLDNDASKLKSAVKYLSDDYSPSKIFSVETDITRLENIQSALKNVLRETKNVHILINNAAVDPKVASNGNSLSHGRFESFSLTQWNQEIAVGLTGAFLCAQTFGTYMSDHGGGVILNICSDLALIAPDQRIYRKKNLKETEQPVKPVTYSVIKTALLGLTRYLATYWADKNIRVNALSPGGVSNNQPEDFVQRLSNLIPLGRMATPDEYKAAIVFLVSDASSYMTGANLVIDGGRTCW